MSFGGDTLNTAIYAARLVSSEGDVSYLTRLGDDPYSRNMRRAWENERIDTSFVSIEPERTVGLYAIATDEFGERSFTYWRDATPARELFQGRSTETELAALAKADVLYLSGITLAVLSETGRSNLIYAMHVAKSRGAIVAFDPNYRANLWENHSIAARLTGDAISASNLVFTSEGEQKLLFGDKSRKESSERLRDAGVSEWILREGSGPLTIGFDEQESELLVEPVKKPLDTTGAGDAFNGAYLAGRVRGRGPVQAGEHAAKVAARVIQHRGAIIGADQMQDLMG